MGRPSLLVEAMRSYSNDLEDRLTEVLATVLDVHDGFCRLLAVRIGMKAHPAQFKIRTQQVFNERRARVDLVLEVRDAGEGTVAIVFFENKYNPSRRLGARWFDGDQYERQRTALHEQESGETLLVGIASACDLQRLSGPEEVRPKYDPTREAYDEVISWDDVKELAREAGGKPGWEADARRPDAMASQRLLLEFIAYLNQKGAPVGAVDDDDIFVISRAALAEERIERLLEIAAETVAEELDKTDEECRVEPIDEDDPNAGWQVSLEPPPDTWLASLKEAQLNLMITTAPSEGEAQSVGSPCAYAGVSWNAGKEGRDAITGSTWEARVKKASLTIAWEQKMCSIGVEQPVRGAVGGADTLAEQAKLVAEWAHPIILDVLRLPSPPNTDREAGSQREVG